MTFTDDIYLVFDASYSAFTVVFEYAISNDYATCRKSNDGSKFIVKFSAFADMPIELVDDALIFNHTAMIAYLEANPSDWEEI